MLDRSVSSSKDIQKSSITIAFEDKEKILKKASCDLKKCSSDILSISDAALKIKNLISNNQEKQLEKIRKNSKKISNNYIYLIKQLRSINS